MNIAGRIIGLAGRADDGHRLPMDLRPATLLDLPDIAQLHEANWRRDYVDLLPEVALGTPLSTYMKRRWTAASLASGRIFVARDRAGDEEPTTLFGFALLVDHGPHDCRFLDCLHVAPQARAQGVGRALMAACAVLTVPGPLSLEVLSDNTPARAIYRGWGGVESAEFEDEIMGYPVSSVSVGWRDTVALVDRLSGHTP